MNILVTGAAGYIGQVLCQRLLIGGHYVIAVDNLMYGQAGPLHLCYHPRFEFHRADVRGDMGDYVRRADVIIPLAAIVGAPACDASTAAAKEINRQAVWKLRWLTSKDQLIIFPNTNSGYGTTSGETPCTEETPLRPISLYARTKCEAEDIILEKDNAISLRLATVFGASPRMRWDLMVNDFVRQAVTDGYLVLYEPGAKRNFVHVMDVADCMNFCIEHHRKMGGVYNLGLDDANLSKLELAERIKAHVPNLLIHCAEVGNDPDKRNYVVSNEKLRQAGFEARRTLDQGIEELIKACRMMPLVWGNA